MTRANATVKKETWYIAYFCTILSVLMQCVFILLKKWSYTVLLGNLFSLAVAVINFLAMGITVQKAVTMEPEDAKKLVRSSQKKRNILIFLALAIGVIVPFFNTASVIVPVFFPRIAFAFRPLIKDKKEVVDK